MEYEHVQVRSNALVIFPPPSGIKYQRYNLDEERDNTYSGTLTDTARKRLCCAIDILIQRNPKRKVYNPITKTSHDFDINFITLTLHSARPVTASEGYEKCLSKWIRYMRDKYGLDEYVWKCELQQNGQPHWHICTNKFIEWPVVRWKWNQVQRQAGFLNVYGKKHGHFNANSTDIHGVEKHGDLLRYISKEVSKKTFIQVANGDPVKNVRFDRKTGLYTGEMYEAIDPDYTAAVTWDASGNCIDYPGEGNKLMESRLDGKVWDCSEVLKGKRFSAELDTDSWQRIRQAVWNGYVTQVEAERCKIIKTVHPLRLLSPQMVKDWKNYIH